jgi:hypothetical protein
MLTIYLLHVRLTTKVNVCVLSEWMISEGIEGYKEYSIILQGLKIGKTYFLAFSSAFPLLLFILYTQD